MVCVLQAETSRALCLPDTAKQVSLAKCNGAWIKDSSGSRCEEVAIHCVYHTSRGRPTFTESNCGIPTSSKSSVRLESLLYDQAELSVPDRDLLLLPCGHSRARTARANPARPKHFPPRTNPFQANRAGGPCAPKIGKRALQSLRANIFPSFSPPCWMQARVNGAATHPSNLPAIQ